MCRLFNSDNFATSAALAEECALLSAVLVTSLSCNGSSGIHPEAFGRTPPPGQLIPQNAYNAPVVH